MLCGAQIGLGALVPFSVKLEITAAPAPAPAFEFDC